MCAPPITESRFQINDEVIFNPDLNHPIDSSKAIEAKIVAIKFSNKGKVLYDIAVRDPGSPSVYYEVLPLQDVDSFMIKNKGENRC
jgi:hypothetical protein